MYIYAPKQCTVLQHLYTYIYTNIYTCTYTVYTQFFNNIIILIQYESRLRWYGHILRRDENEAIKRMLRYRVEGEKCRGRPKKTWQEVIRNDMKACGLSDEMAWDRNQWRMSICLPTLTKVGNTG